MFAQDLDITPSSTFPGRSLLRALLLGLLPW
jgi:hypothetical protein